MTNNNTNGAIDTVSRTHLCVKLSITIHFKLLGCDTRGDTFQISFHFGQIINKLVNLNANNHFYFRFGQIISYNKS